MKTNIFIEFNPYKFWKYILPQRYYQSFDEKRNWYKWLFWNIKINKVKE